MLNFIFLGVASLSTTLMTVFFLVQGIGKALQHKEILPVGSGSIRKTFGLSVALAIIIFFVTGGNICLVLLTTVGVAVSMSLSIVGLIGGIWVFLKRNQLPLVILWVIIFFPAFLLSAEGISEYRHSQIPVTIENDKFNGTKTFNFSNFISLTVAGNSVDYIFKRYPNTTFAGHDELSLQANGFRCNISDQSGNWKLIVDGQEYKLRNKHDIVTVHKGPLLLKMSLESIPGV